ncbi:MAG: hypothetical protein ACLRWL_06495 [Evtepia gabavorous]
MPGAGDHPVWRGSLRTLHPHRPFLHRAVHAEFTAILVGLLAGALTSTPADSAAKATVATAELESLVSVGYGIAYLFGVVGVVLFVQLIPKLTHADLDRERDRLTQVSQNAARRTGRVCLDEFGLMPLALAIVCGIVVGSCKVETFPDHHRRLPAGRSGLWALWPDRSGQPDAQDTTLKAMRELPGPFPRGAGVAGGSRFAEFSTPSTLSMASS